MQSSNHRYFLLLHIVINFSLACLLAAFARVFTRVANVRNGVTRSPAVHEQAPRTRIIVVIWWSSCIFSNFSFASWIFATFASGCTRTIGTIRVRSTRCTCLTPTKRAPRIIPSRSICFLSICSYKCYGQKYCESEIWSHFFRQRNWRRRPEFCKILITPLYTSTVFISYNYNNNSFENLFTCILSYDIFAFLLYFPHTAFVNFVTYLLYYTSEEININKNFIIEGSKVPICLTRLKKIFVRYSILLRFVISILLSLLFSDEINLLKFSFINLIL